MNNDAKTIVRSYRDLEVYQKAYDVSLEIHKLTLEYPDIERFEMAAQMRRASKSICANIAEGFAKQRHSAAEFNRFIQMAIASSDEMKVWLEYSVDLGYMPATKARRFFTDYVDIAKMLSGLAKSWQAKKRVQPF
jgi:four helix bundle protein